MSIHSRLVEYRKEYPDRFILSQEIDDLEKYLLTISFLERNEIVVEIIPIGDGNMNFTVRVRTNFRTFIIKQARPWVEKYPQFDAPLSRSSYEARFYHETSGYSGIRSRMPELLFYCEKSYLIIYSDLSDAVDVMGVYSSGEKINDQLLEAAIDWLSALHGIKSSLTDVQDNNVKMRELNYEHIFSFPFRENNGFDLDQITDGLEEVADDIRKDKSLLSIIKKLGDRYYLHPKEQVLLHGDFFLGSWLSKDDQLFIIDPEFMFYGEKEWDLSVFFAHLILTGHEAEEFIALLELYQMVHKIELEVIYQLAGVEIIRRLIGVAQLPLPLSLEKKKNLLVLARGWVIAS